MNTVKNSDLGPLGPAPVRGTAAEPPLSGRRAVVLERLQQVGASTTIVALAAELGVHPNTVREHLDALVDRGLAVRGQEQGRGRGRPAWTYVAATDNVEPDQRVRDYAGLATALAAHIARTSHDAGTEALDAGIAWGHELAAAHQRKPAPSTARAARGQIVDLLQDLGFDPVANPAATTVALRRCPLLDAAKRYPNVVCQVHLGIVRGAMDVVGGDPTRTALLPFAERGACRLHLLTRG